MGRFFEVSPLFFALQGFLAKDLQAEALSKLDQRVKVAAEQFMKILEQIDAIVISFWIELFIPRVLVISNTLLSLSLFPLKSVPENFNDFRVKKRGLIKTVQVSQ